MPPCGRLVQPLEQLGLRQRKPQAGEFQRAQAGVVVQFERAGRIAAEQLHRAQVGGDQQAFAQSGQTAIGREPGTTVESLGAFGQHLDDRRQMLEHHSVRRSRASQVTNTSG